MSDRIDRLVNRANNMRLEGWENAQAVHDLAIIAREAEANAKGQEANVVFALQLKREAEARAAEWIDRCYESEERALKAEAERDALLVEHEAVGEGYGDETADVGCGCLSCRIIRAHDNAERVIHGE